MAYRFLGVTASNVSSRPQTRRISDFAPDPIVVLVAIARIDEIDRRQGLKLAAPEMVDDQAVEHGAEVVAKPPFGFVRPCQFVGEQLGPEVLENLIRQVRVAHLQANVPLDGIVIATDQVAHGRLPSGADRVRRADHGPACFQAGELLGGGRL